MKIDSAPEGTTVEMAINKIVINNSQSILGFALKIRMISWPY